MPRKGGMSRWMQKTKKAACREIARNAKGRFLELCKAFGVQTENTHSQSGCGYDQIRLYELTLSCRSLQTVAASSICKTPTLRG